MKSIIGWRTFKGYKKQHLFKYGNGRPYMYCHGTTPNALHVEGRSTIEINKDDLLVRKSLLKCKKCLKEQYRIDWINSFNHLKKAQ